MTHPIRLASMGGAAPVYIEDVFSTYLYTGNGSTQTITNGIDLAGKGGLVWTKRRDGAAWYHHLGDTVRGAGNILFSNATDANTTGTGAFTAFSSTGFSFDAAQSPAGVNFSSWTFRKQPKFFDVVTYTGNGSTQTIAHSLGSAPGFIVVKRTDSGGTGWVVYHRSLGTTSGYPNYVTLNTTGAESAGNASLWAAAPTSTNFTVGNSAAMNASGGTFVAYIFAHNAGGFGLTGTDNVISCGSFTTGASGITTVDLGYEPQYLLFKTSTAVGDWVVVDVMRGFSMTDDLILSPNTSGAESPWGGGYVKPTATGFTADSSWIGTSRTFIYIAIRRGPMKVPTDATKVFNPTASSAATGTVVTTGFPPDTIISNFRAGYANNSIVADRLRGALSPGLTGTKPWLQTATTDAERAGNVTNGWDNTGFAIPSMLGSVSSIYWTFGRAPGFFDEVCYTGTGSATTVTHNLGVVPELMIAKRRDSAGYDFLTYVASVGATKYMVVNGPNAPATFAVWNDTAPTSSVFSVGTDAGINASGATYVTYLFATCPGVSKVGSYTGNGGAAGTNGSSQNIDCGFTGGARFVLIKCTSNTGGWYVFDSARGIVSGGGADPFLLLNSTAAENASDDALSALASGFTVNQTVTSGLNITGRTYIYLAIA